MNVLKYYICVVINLLKIKSKIMELKSIVDYLGLEVNRFKLYHKNGELALEYNKNSDGNWCESTYDTNGNELTFKDSKGYWEESTYDTNGNELTFKDSDGYWCESTYDDNGNELTFKNSDGVTRGFDKKEMNIEEIQQKIGYKIKIVE